MIPLINFQTNILKKLNTNHSYLSCLAKRYDDQRLKLCIKKQKYFLVGPDGKKGE